MLSVCSQKEFQVTSFEQLQKEFININNNLQPKNNVAGLLPFSENYLKQRNELLQAGLRLEAQKLSDSQRAELVLLTIEQRAASRYFSWPAGSSPVMNMLKSNYYTINDATNWVSYTQKRLELGAKDKLLLTRTDLSTLKQSVDATKVRYESEQALFASLSELSAYLEKYTPRRLSGLLAIANGKEQYQARLNFFTNTNVSPDEILSVVSNYDQLSDQNELFLRCYLRDQCNNTQGLDWRTDYSNRLEEYTSVPLTNIQKVIALTDLGIHHQGWRDEHALAVLARETTLSVAEQQAALTKIVREPGLALVNFSHEYVR